MPHGLTDRDIRMIVESAKAFPEISELILFGSRAKGTHKVGSDVDVAIKGTSLTRDTALKLADLLNEEKPLPYFFDVIQYETIAEPRLVEHIDRVGVVLYSRDAEENRNCD